MPYIKFRATIAVDNLIEDGLDKDYYQWELDVDDFEFTLRNPFIEVEGDMIVKWEDDDLSIDDVWFKIEGEFDRPAIIDSGY